LQGRTPDLGKWNISCSKESHQHICNWIDENLVNFWSTLPNSADFPKIGTFPTPERLSKGRVASSGSSVASGLTNASPVDDYLRQLESGLPPHDTTANPTRNAWKNHLPIGVISYSFNTAEFPKLFDTDHQKATTSPSPTLATSPASGSITNGATAVSAITESMVANTVHSGIIAFKRRRKVADKAFDAQTAQLVLEVSEIQQKVAHMADQIQNAVIEKLTADDGVISKLVVRQDKRIDEMKVVMFQMAASLKHLLPRENTLAVYQPARSPRELEIPSGDSATNECTLPPRSRQKPNGAPTERGTGTHHE
jgi:hypothetical protein